MNTTTFFRYQYALLGNHALPVSIAAVLAWLMLADGDVNPEEVRYLDAFQSAQGIGEKLWLEIVSIGQMASVPELNQAFVTIQQRLAPDARMLLLDLILGMVLADGRIHASEKLIMELIVDAIGIGADGFKQRYQEVVGRPYSSPGDVSSAAWWHAFEHQREKRANGDSAHDRNTQNSYRSNRNGERIRALSILGLEEGADASAIQAAFRRLAMVHHPDRFQNLGPEAQNTAHETFVRIKNAYEFLRTG